MELSQVRDFIRQKTKKLMKEHGTKKVEIGSVLGDGREEVRQQQFSRAMRFLDGDSSIKIGAVLRIARYFKKPLSYFFPPEVLFPEILSAPSGSKNTQKALQEISENLRKLGFDEDFIKAQVRQLKAMEAYSDGEKS